MWSRGYTVQYRIYVASESEALYGTEKSVVFKQDFKEVSEEAERRSVQGNSGLMGQL